MQNGTSAEDVNKSSFERPLAAPSDVTQSPSLPASAEINDNTQLLRLETINATESRRIMLFIKVTIALALIGAVLLAAIKESPRGIDMIVLNRNFVIMQVVTFAILLGSLLLMFAVWGTAVARSFHNKMVWSPRRLPDVQATLLCACAATVIMSGQFANNVRLLTDPSTFCYSKEFTAAIGFLIFTGFDTLLLLLVIKAHGTNLTSGKDHTHSTVRDAPWTSHWPKVVFIWLPYLGVVMWIVLMIAEDGHSVEVAVAGGGACGWGADVVCSTSAAFNISGVLSVIAIVAYFALYVFYLVRAWRQLSTKLYQKFRLQNIVLLIQLRVNAAMVGTLLVSMALTWYLSQNPCVNYAVTWFGVPSVGLTVVSIQAVAFYATYPRSRRAVAAHEAAPTYLLQQFAWTEPEVPRKLAARAEAIRGSPAAAAVTAAPLFCFETAIKLFFWSVLVYSYTEADPSDIRKVPDAMRKLIGGMEAAMRMFDLSKHHMFYDRACGTKVLVTWNAATILVVVRGTAEAANFLQDAKFLQTAHPPVRKFKGRTPRVHTGFLATWQSNGIRARILEHVSALLDSAEEHGAVRVLCNGHSLGGAVAQLASIDIARELGVGPHNIKVYTYGCPRLGNHALAEEVDEVVLDTWHIINDNDIVTSGMKLLGLYKRAGQRVIVNSRGHLIVRPSHLETSLLQRMRGGKGARHMTVEYQRSLVAIVTAQLQASSRLGDGLHGLLGLLKGVHRCDLRWSRTPRVWARRSWTSYAASAMTRTLAARLRRAMPSEAQTSA